MSYGELFALRTLFKQDTLLEISDLLLYKAGQY